MKKYLVLLVLTVTSFSVNADEFVDKYFSGNNPRLTNQEKMGVEIAKKWKSGSSQNVAPIVGQDGSIQFLYGVQQTSIVCAVLQVCDIALQPGEQITGKPHIGDNARWIVEPAVTGASEKLQQHIIIKPMDIGLMTTLIIPTDRRIYHLNLKSHKTEYMPKVSFSYPDADEEKWEAIIHQEKMDQKAKTIPETGESLGELDFNYTIKGSTRWKPVRVYNDGVRTIIQMPEEMRQTESPTFLVLRGKENVIVNYRVQKNRFIIDTVFDKGMLIAGVGRNQDKVTIIRGLKNQKHKIRRK